MRAAGLVVAVAAMTVLGAGSSAAVGGASVAVADGGYGFSAKLDIGAGVRSCSGALVSDVWVIMAKSCFPENTSPGAPALATKATIGRTSLSSSAGHVVDVTHVVPRTDRNVALVRISRPVTDIRPIGLGQTAPASGDVLRVTGYGRTATEWVPDRLHAGNFGVQSLTGSTLAVEGVAPELATLCKGDAGGPAFRDGTNPELVGVTGASWQGGCLGETETRRGAVETRTDDIVDWIVGLELEPVAASGAKSVSLSWRSPGYSVSQFAVYGSIDPNFTVGPDTLLGNAGSTLTFVHNGLKPKQAWYYRVMAIPPAGSTGPVSAVASATPVGSLPTDFDGDRKEDVATFLRGDSGDLFVARSAGDKFLDDDRKWHEYFAPGAEYPLSGDFNGDGKADVVTFFRGTTGDVHVALSDGTKFGAGSLWHGDFAYGAELPFVGDFNGDGKDDIAVFSRGVSGDVYVSLSDGTKFVQHAWRWHDYFAPNSETPAVGDFNGDGKDDIVTFLQGSSGDVYVALSTGSSFGPGPLWHGFFAPNSEVPGVGDFNGDGKDDIVTFLRGSSGDVYVSLSDGTKFVHSSWQWHDLFAPNNEVPGIGDFNGDGRDDIVTFLRGPSGDVYVALSTGSSFGPGPLWHDYFAPNNETPQPRLIPIP